MWTLINGLFTSNDGQNVWVNLAADNLWHQVLPGAPDGVTNVLTILATARGNDRYVYVVLDAANNITLAYM
jgi:hypothetical protein